MKFFPRKNIFLHPKSEPENRKFKKKTQGEATSDRCEGEREKETCVMCMEHHVVYFLQSIVVSAWPCSLLFFGFVHTHETWHIFFRKLCLPIRWKFSPCFARFFCLCVDVQIFQICPYTCSLCSAGDLSSLWWNVSFPTAFLLCVCLTRIRSVFFPPFFRLLIYYVPKKNCYRWEAYLIFLFWISNI